MILPVGISMTDWADSTALELDKYGPVFRLDDERDWRTWASYVVGIPQVQTVDPPTPAQFSSFRDWAQRFVEAWSHVV